MKVDKLLLGCDPEGFFRLNKGGKTFESAHGLLPGTKEEPHKVDCGAVQVDGMAWEYNIDPASTEEEFVTFNMKVMDTIKKMAPDYDMVTQPVCYFSNRVWDTQPEEALILGCEPDFNAYTGKENPAPNQEEKFRSASGHIHLGWTEGQDIKDPSHFEACQMMAKQLDYVLAIPSLFMEGKDGKKRRSLYGKAGCFRPKPYGMEYRTLSNFWVGDEEVMRWVYQQTQRAFQKLLEGEPLYKDREEALQSYIDGFGDKLTSNTVNTTTQVWPGVEFPESLVAELRGDADEDNLKWITKEQLKEIKDKDSVWKDYLHSVYKIDRELLDQWSREFEEEVA